jgi:uncharacterized protein Smg (DUF494 family)
MKNSWFELMLNFFEKTIMHLKEQYMATNNTGVTGGTQSVVVGGSSDVMPKVVKVHVEHIKSPESASVRVFTPGEQMKLTKASYQFLMRLAAWGIVSPETLELIINRLVFSDSRVVSLQETKWTIRTTLAGGLNFEQVAFLDLLLYQKEDGLPLH